MARYYESESLIDFVKQNTPHINGETTMKCVEFAIKNAPTADVVPKSEYDEVLSNWQKIRDSYTADCIRHYNIGRQEVASEIFEEIDKLYVVNGAESVSILDYRFHKGIAELKKKYTEGGKSKGEKHCKKIFDDLMANSTPYVDKDDGTVFFCIKSKTFKKIRKKYTEATNEV